MLFDPPLKKATLIKRYKRFLADVMLDDGAKMTIYCPNTGAMTGCGSAGDTIFYSTSTNSKRKYPHTWEFTLTQQQHLICIHAAKANTFVANAIKNQQIPALLHYSHCQKEVRYGAENSRIDFLLTAPQKAACYVEVKSCTLLDARSQAGDGYFPDTVSLRGQKHLRELIAMKQQGHRSVLLFVVFHSGITRVKAAHFIDKAYALLFNQAKQAGVEVITYHPHLWSHIEN